MKEEIEKEVTEEVIEEKDMTPILLEDLGISSPKGSKYRYHYGLFKCQYCGKEFKTRLGSVKSGNTGSCGCQIKGRKITHGLRHHKFYNKWNAMMNRCYNKKSSSYSNYGGRGINVCEEWHDTKNFVKWAEETYIEGCTIDRIDNDGNYEPSNCRWVDKIIQNVNQRKNKNNTSGYVGVHWHKVSKVWVAGIYINKNYIYLRAFTNKMGAVKARDKYIIENNLPHKLSTDYKEESK